MKVNLIIVVAIVSLYSIQAQAVYKCVVEGKTVFSQTRCADDAAEVDVQVRTPSEEEMVNTAERNEAMSGQLAKNQARRDARKIKNKIAKLEKSIRRHQINMDADLAIIKAKKATANNNLAGATYEQSLSTEMKAVVDKYTSKIDFAKDKIKQLNSQLERVEQNL